jgi:hypothetical protein
MDTNLISPNNFPNNFPNNLECFTVGVFHYWSVSQFGVFHNLECFTIGVFHNWSVSQFGVFHSISPNNFPNNFPGARLLRKKTSFTGGSEVQECPGKMSDKALDRMQGMGTWIGVSGCS